MRLLTSALLFAAFTAPLTAQTPEPRNVVSVNPIGIVFEVLSAEYERALSKNGSLALSSTLWNHSEDFDDGEEGEVTYFSTDLKLRYYPGTALRGFAIGATGGFTLLEGEVQNCDFSQQPCETDSESVPALSAGVTMDYAWRLGDSERFFMALGWGAKRLFPTEDVDATVAYPFLRFNVGWVF